eukprot:TRINITY_DN33395_c0_g1_i1.p1 TRINITY_DN33395_c0_g1~~TRINITY_DN33395_c0_g1_i1.p1  ORF type:complete len:423 (+),score=64.61 TRINITY_DN33395_c0_g1_i1:3-1271(+)
MGLCTGPGIPNARKGVAALWISLFSITVIAYFSTGCVDAEVGRVPVIPAWVWLFWIPAFIACAYVEFQCFKLTTIPYGQVLKRFLIFRRAVPFRAWLAILTCLSQLQRLDMATDGFFVANALADPICNGRIDEVWQLVMERSMFRTIHLDHVLQFHRVVLLSFMCMTAQLLYPLLHTSPKDSQVVDYDVIGPRRPDGSEAILQFENYLGETVNFGDALHLLGEPMGASTLTLQKPSFPKQKADVILQSTPLTTDNLHRSLSFVRNTLVQGVVTIGLVALLENAFQINLQVSVFAMKRAVLKDDLWQWHWAPQLFSISLSFIVSLEKIKAGIELLWFWRSTTNRILEATRDGQTHSTEDEFLSDKRWRKTNWHMKRLVVLLLLLILATSYALVKFIKVFQCKDSLWNLSGCVDLEAAGFVRTQ